MSCRVATCTGGMRGAKVRGAGGLGERGLRGKDEVLGQKRALGAENEVLLVSCLVVECTAGREGH